MFCALLNWQYAICNTCQLEMQCCVLCLYVRFRVSSYVKKYKNTIYKGRDSDIQKIYKNMEKSGPGYPLLMACDQSKLFLKTIML